MKRYRKYLLILLILIAFCVSICFIPIDATRFIPQVEKQFEQNLGIRVHIEKLIFRFGPSLKIKAPMMHLMYQDGQKFGQLDNVKFFVPWSTLFKDDIYVKRIYADKFIVKTSSSDKYLSKLIERLNTKEYDSYPNFILKNYSILYNSYNENRQYLLKGNTLELTKLINYKNLKLVTDGNFYINDKHYINYDISFVPNIEFDNNQKVLFDFKEFVHQIESLDFHTDIKADLKLYKNFDNVMQISGITNFDNISVLDPDKKNPKSFIYLTFFGNKTGVLSNIYASADKKIYVQGVMNNSKKPELDLRVKTDKINISDIYKKFKLIVDCSKYKGIDSISGVMNADFNVKGDLNRLKSSGFMKISDASIKAGNLSINKINSDIDFSNNVISICNAVGYVNNAPIMLKGTVNKNINLELLMDKVELKHLLTEKYGIQKGVITLTSKIYGTTDKLFHKENIKLDNLLLKKNNNQLSFDSLTVDTNKDNVAYISNIIIKSDYADNIKIPMFKPVINENKINIPDTNIFMSNSKIKAKGEISDYNTNELAYNVVFDGFINSKDLTFLSKNSMMYPIRFVFNGNKNTQNMEGQVHIANAFLLEEPSLINIAAKYENNVLKIDDLSLLPFNDKLSDNFKSNIKGSKKIIISGNIENVSEPIFKNLRIFIPQQITLNILDAVMQVKGDVFINGDVKQPEIVGQINAQNVVLQFMQTIMNNVSVEFNKNIAVLNAPVVKIADTSAGINAVISTNISKELLVKNLNIKSKFFSVDTLLMYKDKLISAFPIVIKEGKFYSERLSATLYNSPLYISAFNSDLSLDKNILHLNNISAELYNGKMAGSMDYDLKTETYSSKIQGRGVSAAPIFDIIAINKDTVSGVMDFDSSLTGNLTTKDSISGVIKFIVHNGHMGTLGKLEHLLYAQNVVADNMLRTSLSVITKAITLKDTGLFKYLRGDITITDGMAYVNSLQSQGPLMSLFIKGQYQPSTDYAKLVILGRLSDEIVSGLGAFGEFSFNKLMIMLTGDENKLNISVEDIDKLPQLPMKNTKEFRTVINGILEKPSSVIRFNWISYTQKSLKQTTVPSSNEKVPAFIEALPY